jgi:hypothetical protein
VVLLVLAVCAGLAAGVGRTPAGAHSIHPRVEQIPLLGLGALLNGASVVLDGTPATLALAASLAVLITVATTNRHITGVAVVGVGLFVNLVVVALNGGMPVRGSALVAADVVEASQVASTELDGARHLETGSDTLGVLGDVLPIPLAREVMSFGDLIVVVGAGDAVRELSRRRARRPVRAGSVAYPRFPATTAARVVQDWGTAPSAAPVSASQYSANPDAEAPATIDLDSEAAAARSPELVTASHSR